MLEWLLENEEQLSKRAYLAKFLVKLDVPPEIRFSFVLCRDLIGQICESALTLMWLTINANKV